MPRGDVLVRDTWSPLLSDILEALEPSERRKVNGKLAIKTVSRVKLAISRSKGFGTGKKYRKLRIEFRYHGTKELQASRKNVKRAGRRKQTSSQRMSGTISVADKTAVTSATKPLMDLGDLRRSWDVLKHNEHGFEVGPNNPNDAAKAFYNDDRGEWEWSDKRADQVLKQLAKSFDKTAGI